MWACLALASVASPGEDPAKLKIVFFDSGGEAATALMGGHITVAVTPAAVVLGPSKAGKIRMIGLPAATRQKGDLADIPQHVPAVQHLPGSRCTEGRAACILCGAVADDDLSAWMLP